MVRKRLQEKMVCIDATLKQIDAVKSYFQKYRDQGFNSSIESAKAIALDMGIDEGMTNGPSIFAYLVF
jgi:hypothetical protein